MQFLLHHRTLEMFENLLFIYTTLLSSPYWNSNINYWNISNSIVIDVIFVNISHVNTLYIFLVLLGTFFLKTIICHCFRI